MFNRSAKKIDYLDSKMKLLKIDLDSQHETLLQMFHTLTSMKKHSDLQDKLLEILREHLSLLSEITNDQLRKEIDNAQKRFNSTVPTPDKVQESG